MFKRNKLSSAGYQQERSRDYFRGYVVGLVDGEGSFHIAFQVRSDLPLGISIIPEFHISQNYLSKNVLEIAQNILGCGYVKPNHKNSKDSTYVLVVRDRIDLLTKIIPFFEVNQLKTIKKNDFRIFSRIVRLIDKKYHKNLEGVKKIIDLAYKMNGNGQRRIRSKNELISLLKSPETIRKISTNPSEKI